MARENLFYAHESIVFQFEKLPMMFSREGVMIFPLDKLVKFDGNIYEITVAANKRAYQMSMVKDPLIEENHDKVVSLAAEQLFGKEVTYRIQSMN